MADITEMKAKMQAQTNAGAALGKAVPQESLLDQLLTRKADYQNRMAVLDDQIIKLQNNPEFEQFLNNFKNI